MESKRNYKTLLPLFCILILAACSQDSNPLSPQSSGQNVNTQQGTSNNSFANKEEKYSDEIESVDGPRSVIYSYWAMAKVPVDYSDIASLISSKYRNERNEYKKDEILKTLQPSIDEEISRYKSFNKFRVDTGSYVYTLKDFDYQYKFFPINEMSDGSYFSFNEASAYQLKFTNGSRFSRIQIDDKDLVERINKLSANFATHLNIYYTSLGDEIGNTVILAKITKVELLDNKGNVLAIVQ